jgi:hypothetical protein
VTSKDVSSEAKWESKWGKEILKTDELVFVPNAHIGPYMRADKIQDVFYIYFGAHLPEGSDVHVPELDRADIVSRISALADDTRLQILQMIAENGEMRSQEIMEMVNQPAQRLTLFIPADSGWISTGRRAAQSLRPQQRSNRKDTEGSQHLLIGNP